MVVSCFKYYLHSTNKMAPPLQECNRVFLGYLMNIIQGESHSFYFMFSYNVSIFFKIRGLVVSTITNSWRNWVPLLRSHTKKAKLLVTFVFFKKTLYAEHPHSIKQLRILPLTDWYVSCSIPVRHPVWLGPEMTLKMILLCFAVFPIASFFHLHIAVFLNFLRTFSSSWILVGDLEGGE